MEILGEKITNKSIFDKNLLELSLNKDLEEAKKEWEMLKEDNSIDKKMCLCNHKLQKIKYFFNKRTLHIVVIGSECSKKFGMNKNTMKNEGVRKLLEKILFKKDNDTTDNTNNNINQVINNNEKEKIEDLHLYSQKMRLNFIDKMRRENILFEELVNTKSVKTYEEDIENHRIHLNILINDYGMFYLEEIKNEFMIIYEEYLKKNKLYEEKLKEEYLRQREMEYLKMLKMKREEEERERKRIEDNEDLYMRIDYKNKDKIPRTSQAKWIKEYKIWTVKRINYNMNKMIFDSIIIEFVNVVDLINMSIINYSSSESSSSEDEDDDIYIKINYKNKDNIPKNCNAKWDGTYKLWYMKKVNYNRYKSELDKIIIEKVNMKEIKETERKEEQKKKEEIRREKERIEKLLKEEEDRKREEERIKKEEEERKRKEYEEQLKERMRIEREEEERKREERIKKEKLRRDKYYEYFNEDIMMDRRFDISKEIELINMEIKELVKIHDRLYMELVINNNCKKLKEDIEKKMDEIKEKNNKIKKKRDEIKDLERYDYEDEYGDKYNELKRIINEYDIDKIDDYYLKNNIKSFNRGELEKYKFKKLYTDVKILDENKNM
jgi:hypothetical protein